MIDDKIISTIEQIEQRLEEIETVVKQLDEATEGYLQWMAENRYTKGTRQAYALSLKQFRVFIRQRKCSFEEIFTDNTLRQFKQSARSSQVHAIYGLCRYLFDHKKIPQPLSPKGSSIDLPKIYKDYLFYYQQQGQWAGGNIRRIRRVLCAFDDYLQKEQIDLFRLAIEHVDAFLAQFLAPFKPATGRVYRSSLRGFLTYLYQECHIIKRDLASFIVAKRHYGLTKPPKFLRPREIQKLFAGVSLSSDSDIRTYAMMHLAYSLGLRPKEITLMTLDDICFKKAELTVEDRKNKRPVTLPVPEATLKAVAAYRIAVRPESKHRTLFLSLHPPYGPISPNTISQHVRKAMKAAGLPSTTYWLRHSYAQNLLEGGASVFEVKEMLGHDDIESTKKYLHVHTKLMRQVLLNKPFESFLAKHLEEYVAYRHGLGYAKQRITPWLLAFDRYLQKQNINWDQLQPSFFLQLRAEIREHPNTVNEILIDIRGFFRFLVRKGILDQNPLKDIPRLPKHYSVPFVFSQIFNPISVYDLEY